MVFKQEEFFPFIKQQSGVPRCPRCQRPQVLRQRYRIPSPRLHKRLKATRAAAAILCISLANSHAGSGARRRSHGNRPPPATSGAGSRSPAMARRPGPPLGRPSGPPRGGTSPEARAGPALNARLPEAPLPEASAAAPAVTLVSRRLWDPRPSCGTALVPRHLWGPVASSGIP